jgi:ribokinase
MMREFDCLCATDMCVDLMVYGNVRPQFRQIEQLVDGYTLELGGSGNLFCAQLARLGAHVGVIGYVGNDPFGSLVRNRLHDVGVDTSRVKTHEHLPTGLGVTLIEPGDRAILTTIGTIDAASARDLTTDVLTTCRHWHIASYFLLHQFRPYWADWLWGCRAAGVTTSLDTNWDPDDEWLGVLDLLPLVDVFLPNEVEALRITGAEDVLTAGRQLAQRCRVVAIKCGESGAYAFMGDDVTHRLPAAREARTIVDTVGAGDAFDAGFIRAWQQGYAPDACLEWGMRCAESTLNMAGGIAGQLRELCPPAA